MNILRFILKNVNMSLIILPLLIGSCQLINSFANPYRLDTPVVWETFHSKVKPISIDYPNSWSAHNLFQGNHGDKEVIAYLRPLVYELPYVIIIHREMDYPSLDGVASWGENRINSPTYKPDTLEEINIGDQKVLLRNYYYENKEKRKITCQHIYLNNRNNAYIIEMCVDEKNDSFELRTAFKHMIESITVN